MEIAVALDGLGRSAHPRFAVRIIRVAAEKAVDVRFYSRLRRVYAAHRLGQSAAMALGNRDQQLARAGRPSVVYAFEAVGAVFMVTVGSALHFAFDWAGGWQPLALVAAVNESIWEHLKLAFWPGVLWAALVPPPGGHGRARALAVKGMSLPMAAGLIVVIFTSYTAILGDNLLLLDIGTFVFAVFAGQAVSAWLLVRLPDRRATVPLGLVLLGSQLAVYGLFTYFPPDHWLFIETRTGVRGIPLT